MAKHYKLITFYRINKPNWHMKCNRKWFSVIKMGIKHIFKGHAIAFSVKNA